MASLSLQQEILRASCAFYLGWRVYKARLAIGRTDLACSWDTIKILVALAINAIQSFIVKLCCRIALYSANGLLAIQDQWRLACLAFYLLIYWVKAALTASSWTCLALLLTRIKEGANITLFARIWTPVIKSGWVASKFAFLKVLIDYWIGFTSIAFDLVISKVVRAACTVNRAECTSIIKGAQILACWAINARVLIPAPNLSIAALSVTLFSSWIKYVSFKAISAHCSVIWSYVIAWFARCLWTILTVFLNRMIPCPCWAQCASL